MPNAVMASTLMERPANALNALETALPAQMLRPVKAASRDSTSKPLLVWRPALPAHSLTINNVSPAQRTAVNAVMPILALNALLVF